jgi:nitrite reductase (NADH) small subunit
VSWYQVGIVDDFPENAGKECVIGGLVIAIFRSGEDWRAIDGMCAHQGGPIAQGSLDQDCVTCPWHGWQYNLSEGCNLLTGTKMLDTYPIELRGSEVWVKADPE